MPDLATGDPELERCPQCGGAYKRVSTHWVQSTECDHPEISAEVLDVCRGMLFAGGMFGHEKAAARFPSIRRRPSSRDLAEWLTSELGWLARPMSPWERSETGSKQLTASWGISTRSHPDLRQLKALSRGTITQDDITPISMGVLCTQRGWIRTGRARRFHVSIGSYPGSVPELVDLIDREAPDADASAVRQSVQDDTEDVFVLSVDREALESYIDPAYHYTDWRYDDETAPKLRRDQ